MKGYGACRLVHVKENQGTNILGKGMIYITLYDMIWGVHKIHIFYV